MQATERLYLTADKSRVVAEGDPAGASLWAAPGDEIPDDDAARFGVVDGAAPKTRRGGANKERKGGEDKAAEGGDDGKPAAGLTVEKLKKGGE